MLPLAILTSFAPTDAPKIDPAALALLRHSAGATFALRTYQAECRTTLTGDDSKEVPQFQLATLRAAKPNKMRYERWDIGAEAAKTWTRPAQPPRYVFACAGDVWHQQFGKILREDNRPSPDNLSTILEPWGGFYDPKESIYAETSGALKRGELAELSLAGTETVDGVPCRRVRLASGGSYNGQAIHRTETLSIGRDGLVRRVLTRYAFGGDPATLTDAILVGIRKNAPIPEATYAYVAPAGVKKASETPAPALLASGTPAPDFEATDADGRTVRLSDLRGKVVVVDFWATWCAPCMASMPRNQEVVAKLQKEGLPVVLLAVDDAETREAFLRVAKSAPRTYPNLRMVHVAKAGSVSGPYRVSSIPTQYVVAKDGNVRASSMGYAGPTDELERSIRAALKAP